jgi:hypothetical protein
MDVFDLQNYEFVPEFPIRISNLLYLRFKKWCGYVGVYSLKWLSQWKHQYK